MESYDLTLKLKFDIMVDRRQSIVNQRLRGEKETPVFRCMAYRIEHG